MISYILPLLITFYVMLKTVSTQYAGNPQYTGSSQADSAPYAMETPYAESAVFSDQVYASKPEPRSGHTYTLEADIPELIRYFFDLPDNSAARSQSGRNLPNQKFKIQITNPDWSSVLESLKSFLRRTSLEGAYTEEGPGTYKSERVVYPKNYQASNLKKLLALKKRMEDRNKRFNH